MNNSSKKIPKKKKKKILPLENVGKQIKKKKKGAKGHEKSRFNATKHGFYSKGIRVGWENSQQFRDLRKGLKEEFKPKGPLEAHLVSELLSVLWQKRRLQISRQAWLESSAEKLEGEARRAAKWGPSAEDIDTDHSDDDDEDTLDEGRRSDEERAQALAAIEPAEELDVLHREDVRLDRKLEKTFAMLLKAQASRKSRDKKN